MYAGMQHSAMSPTRNRHVPLRAGPGTDARASAAVAYFGPEILAIDPSRLDQMMAENAELKTYKHYFDKLNPNASTCAQPR